MVVGRRRRVGGDDGLGRQVSSSRWEEEALAVPGRWRTMKGRQCDAAGRWGPLRAHGGGPVSGSAGGSATADGVRCELLEGVGMWFTGQSLGSGVAARHVSLSNSYPAVCGYDDSKRGTARRRRAMAPA